MPHRFMTEVIEMAVENARAGSGGPFAALVVRNGGVVGRGVNQVTSAGDPTAHAEIVAIRDACRVLRCFQLAGCDLYASCEPCPMCLGAIYWARVDRVFFAGTRESAAAAGFDDSFIYGQLQLPPELRRIPMIAVAGADAGRPFAEWLRNPARVPY